MEGSRFYPNAVCTRILETPPLPNLACASRRLPRTFPDAPTTHLDYFVSYQCNTINPTAPGDVSGSRLIDIVSKIRRCLHDQLRLRAIFKSGSPPETRLRNQLLPWQTP